MTSDNMTEMAIRSLDPTGRGQARWTMCWEAAVNAVDIPFAGPLSTARQQPQPPSFTRFG